METIQTTLTNSANLQREIMSHIDSGAFDSGYIYSKLEALKAEGENLRNAIKAEVKRADQKAEFLTNALAEQQRFFDSIEKAIKEKI